jgi:GTPase SAR1 family protein
VKNLKQNKQAELSQPSQDNVERIQLMHEFAGREGLFIKAFFLDSSLNANLWQVAPDAIVSNLKSSMNKQRFHGRTAPIILLPPGNIYGNDFGHPPEDLVMVDAQEPFRVGDFIEVGQDETTGRAFAVARIAEDIGRTEKDKERIRMAIDLIEKRELAFVSPSIKATEEMHAGNGQILVTKFLVNHLALVKNPAYGEHKAQIRGVCNGDGKSCLKQLGNVQAKKEIHHEENEHNSNCVKKDGVWICAEAEANPQGTEDFIAKCQATGNVIAQVNGERIEFSAEDCVSQWISELSDNHKDWSEDKIIAVAFSKCKKGEKAGSKESLKTKPQSKEVMAEENDKDKEIKNDEIQSRKAQEEHKEKIEKEEQAKKASEEVLKKLEEQEKEIQALKQARQAEVIKPMAERVANAKVQLGSLDSKSLQAEIDELVKLPEGALSKLDMDYQAMMKKAENVQSSTEPRYTYQADDSSKPGEELLKSIRSRLS